MRYVPPPVYIAVMRRFVPIPGHLDNFRIIYLNKAGTGVQPAKVSGKVRWEYPKDAKPLSLYGMVKDLHVEKNPSNEFRDGVCFPWFEAK